MFRDISFIFFYFGSAKKPNLQHSFKYQKNHPVQVPLTSQHHSNPTGDKAGEKAAEEGRHQADEEDGEGEKDCRIGAVSNIHSVQAVVGVDIQQASGRPKEQIIS